MSRVRTVSTVSTACASFRLRGRPHVSTPFRLFQSARRARTEPCVIPLFRYLSLLRCPSEIFGTTLRLEIICMMKRNIRLSGRVCRSFSCRTLPYGAISSRQVDKYGSSPFVGLEAVFYILGKNSPLICCRHSGSEASLMFW